jgi:hypothetical protein
MILLYEFQIILKISNNDYVLISNSDFQIIFMHNSIINLKLEIFQKNKKKEKLKKLKN